MDYEKKYNEALERARDFYKANLKLDNVDENLVLEDIFPELKESEGEKIRKELLEHCKSQAKMFHALATSDEYAKIQSWIDWLEKQGEPNWCHHKVDLSNCSEEYRKAYYDGWNNCNMQHSQCKSDENDVVKCLINGMRFYYEDNEEATWGTEKFSMKVKDILSWLERIGRAAHQQRVEEAMQEVEEKAKIFTEAFQGKTSEEILAEMRGEQKSAWSEKDENFFANINTIIDIDRTIMESGKRRCKDWLKSLKDRVQPQPKQEWSEEDEENNTRYGNRGVELIAKERQRQIEVEGWTKEHDAGHLNDQLALAAVCYALPHYRRDYIGNKLLYWPWDMKWWKPCPQDRVRELVKAGALIAAEIDKIQTQKGNKLENIEL